jgi:hypothetical protein
MSFLRSDIDDSWKMKEMRRDEMFYLLTRIHRVTRTGKSGGDLDVWLFGQMEMGRVGSCDDSFLLLL